MVKTTTKRPRGTNARTSRTPDPKAARRTSSAKPGGTDARTSKPGGTDARTSAAKALVAAATEKAIPAMLPLESIRPSPTNPRKTFNVETLTNSIRAVGFRGRIFVRPRAKKGNPICIRKGDGPWEWKNVDWYEIVFGERRYRAAKAAGLTEIPVDIAEIKTDVLKAIQLVENDEREDLLTSERVAAYGQFAEEGRTAEQIQSLTGRSLAEIRAILLLRRLKPDVLAGCDLKPGEPGHLPRAQAEQIARIPSEEMRDMVAAHVIAGQPHRYTSKLPKPTPDSEILSSRQTKIFIHNECQIQLKGAPFSLEVLDLVKGVPSCAACPNRAGNAAKLDEVYKEVRADMCLDPACYRKKVEAHNARKVDTLKQDGRKFLPPKEAAKVFNGSYDGTSLGYNAPFVDLDRECYEDPKRRTFRSLLNGCLPAEKIIVGIDKAGNPHELLPKSAAGELLKASGKVKVRTAPTAQRKKEIREDRLRYEIIRLGEQYVEAAAANLPSSPTIDKLFVELFAPLVAEFWSETIRKVDSHRKREAEATAKLEGEPVRFQLIETIKPTGAQARGLIARLVAHRELYEGLMHDDLVTRTKENLAHSLFEAVGVDLKRVIEEAEATVDGKPAPKKPEVRATIPPMGKLLDKTPPTLGGGVKRADEPTPAKDPTGGTNARTSGSGSTVSKPSPTAASGWPPVEKVVSVARSALLEKLTACLRRKESEIGSVSKADAPWEARLGTKLVMVKGFSTPVAGKLSTLGLSTVRELLQKADKDEDLMEGARLTLSAAGCTEMQIKVAIDAIETLFRMPSK